MINFTLFLVIALFYSNADALQFWNQHQAVKLYNTKNYDKAATEFEHLLLKDPSDSENLVNMASVLYQQGRFAEAASYFNKVLSTNKKLNSSQIENITFNLGSAYAQQEEWLDALDAFEAVVVINSSNVRAKKNIEIIKKILEKQEQQKQDKDQKKDDSKKDNSKKDQSESEQKDSGKSEQQGQAGNSDDHKKDPEEQKDEQKGKEDGADGQDQSTQQDSNEKRGNEPDQNNQQEQSDTGKQGLSDKQHDKQNSSLSSQEEDKSLSAKKQAQEARQDEINQKLNWQEKKYLEAIAQSDSDANAHMMKMRANKLKSQRGDNEHSW